MKPLRPQGERGPRDEQLEERPAVSTPDSAEEIQRQMARIRCELHEDMTGIVANARTMTDWRYYVGRYPWACVGAAVLAGYFIVPRRLEVVRPDPEALLALARQNKLVVTDKPVPRTRGKVVGPLFNLAANMLVRGLIAYAGQQAGKVFGQEAAEADESSQIGRRPR